MHHFEGGDWGLGHSRVAPVADFSDRSGARHGRSIPPRPYNLLSPGELPLRGKDTYQRHGLRALRLRRLTEYQPFDVFRFTKFG